MVATHVLDERTPGGELAFGQAVAGGRASALFAVLAGVTLALATGREHPPRGRTLAARSAGLVVRALLVAGIGLLLGMLDSGLAVILTYYGLLFCLGVPFLRLRAGALAVLAAVWLVVAPVVSHLVRPSLPDRGFESPHPGQLGDPLQLLSELAFTGYYPVVPWLAYLLAGMAVGRAALGSRRVQAGLVLLGGALAVGADVLSEALLQRPGVAEPLLEATGVRRLPRLQDDLSAGLFGTTPTGGPWEWLLVVAPHSATPFDLAATIGSSLLVIGVALLVVGLLPGIGRRFVAVLFGAGTMTLTLYSLHVVMKTPDVPPVENPESFSTHVLVLGAIGAVYVALNLRGPLERIVGAASSATTRLLDRRE